MESAFGGAFDLKVYATTVDPAEHVALVKGDVASGGPVLVRVHALNTIDDVISTGTHRETLVHKAMEIIGREGRGVIVLIRESQARRDLCAPQAGGREARASSGSSNTASAPRSCSISACARWCCLSNSPARKIVGLEGYGLKVVGHRGLE